MSEVAKTAGWLPVRRTVTDTIVGSVEGEVTNRSLDYGSLMPDEGSTYKRFSPTRSRWPEIAEFDRRARALEQKQATINDELAALEERHNQSQRADKETLAAWVASGNGKRPEPTAPTVERKIAELTENREALSLAVLLVLDEKAKFVERHRDRLRRDAAKAKERAVAQYKRLLGELEEARNEALELRQAELWASLFPDPLAVAVPGPPGVLFGGVRLKGIPGTETQIAASWVHDLLRADSDWIDQALTRDQHATLEGRDPRLPADVGWWEDKEFRAEQARKSREMLEKKRDPRPRWEE